MPLLVPRVRADDAQDTAAADDLALIANLFDARSNLHGFIPLELLDDLGSTRIPRRQLDSDFGTADQPDHDVSQARCHSREHLPPVGESHSEESAREHHFDRSDSRFLRSCLQLRREPERFEHAGGDDFGISHSVDPA